LNQPCQTFITNTKEESHGCEEEEKENEEDVMTETRASYWGRAVRILRFRGVTAISPSG
jgi:hypothetical protein